MRRNDFLIINTFVSLLLVVFTLSACDSKEENVVPITIPTDVECCSAEETFLAYTFLHNGYLKEIESLRDTIDGKYALSVYSRSGKLHVGYNDIFFALTKNSNQGYVRDFSVTEITPLMNMSAMGMKHSTPTASESTTYDESFPAVQHAWVSFVMSSTENDYWELSYKASTKNQSTIHENSQLEVNAIAAGQAWLKSFKVGNDTYYLSLVNPTDWQTGRNTIQAYVSKKSSPATTPYALASETFTIEIDPRMPDMSNHTSPDNTPLTKQADGSYQGNINLTMTGLWRIHLTVKDAEGNIVAGEEELSSLYWDVTI